MDEQNRPMNEIVNTSQLPEGKKAYIKPEIIHELELEIRTGSPFDNITNPLDPLSEE